MLRGKHLSNRQMLDDHTRFRRFLNRAHHGRCHRGRYGRYQLALVEVTSGNCPPWLMHRSSWGGRLGDAGRFKRYSFDEDALDEDALALATSCSAGGRGPSMQRWGRRGPNEGGTRRSAVPAAVLGSRSTAR